MHLIGLTGRAGSGKDTVASILLRHRAGARYAFADPLRAEVADAFGVDTELLGDRDLKDRPHEALRLSRCRDIDFVAAVHAVGIAPRDDSPCSPGQVLQWWCTYYRRMQALGYCLHAATRRVAAAREAGVPLMVICDCRFPNEATWVKRQGGELWRIRRRHVPSVHTHTSESALDGYPVDVSIANDEDLAALERIVVDLAHDIAR